MASSITRFNIEKLDENIVQKHGGSKQVGLKQLGSKQVGFKQLGQKQVGFKQPGPGVETRFHGVQDEKLAQRRSEDKQPEEKTNTDCLVKEQEKEYQTGWKIKTEDTTMSTYLVTRSPSSAIGFKTPIDMLGFFCWLASIKQGMLELVKVKCIFLGYRKGVVGNKALKDHIFEVEPQENVDQEAGLQEAQTQDLMDYQLARVREQHLACKLFGYKEDINEAAFIVAVVEKIYAHESLTFNDTVAYEVIFKWKAGLKDDMDARSDVYVLSNGCRKCSDDSDGYYWEYTPEGHSILSLEGSLSGDCDVEKNSKWSCIYAVGSQEYQVVCTRPNIASASMDMADGFDHGSLKANLQHMKALSITKARYMTFTEAWKKKIWLKGLLAESGYELSLVASALVKGGSWSEVPAQVEGAAYRIVPGQYLALNPKGRALMIAACKKQKLVYVLSRDSVPGGGDGPSGVLVCAENFVIYKNQDPGHPNVCAVIPRRPDLPLNAESL
ncbi:hypothetical protein Tco_0445789 [Tanacetum coccineum]